MEVIILFKIQNAYSNIELMEEARCVSDIFYALNLAQEKCDEIMIKDSVLSPNYYTRIWQKIRT